MTEILLNIDSKFIFHSIFKIMFRNSTMSEALIKKLQADSAKLEELKKGESCT